MDELLNFLDRLEEMEVDYILKRSRADAMMVIVRPESCVYWEVEFFKEGHLNTPPVYLEVQFSDDFENIYYDEEAVTKLDSALAKLKNSENKVDKSLP